MKIFAYGETTGPFFVYPMMQSASFKSDMFVFGFRNTWVVPFTEKNDVAIAETLATFLGSFKSKQLVLEMDSRRNEFCFDCAVIRPEQLASILDAHRQLSLRCGTWTAEQSVVLATRP